MFIIALVTGLVIISLPGPPNGAEAEARKIAIATNLASRSALFEGRTHTLAISRDEWTVRRFENGAWQDLQVAKFDITPTLSVEGVEIDLTPELTPYIVFEPSGQATPFALTLGGVRDRWSITGDASADIQARPGTAKATRAR